MTTHSRWRGICATCGYWPFSGNVRISEALRWCYEHVGNTQGHQVEVWISGDQSTAIRVFDRVDVAEPQLPLEATS